MTKSYLIALFLLVILNGWAQEQEYQHNKHYAFIENKGQWDEDILFKAKFNGGNLWIQQHKLFFHLQDYSSLKRIHDHPTDHLSVLPEIKQDAVHLNFVGSNEVLNIEKTGRSAHYFNFFLGNNSSNWASDVHAYGEAVLHEIYNGIDLKLIEEQDHLKYEFHVLPHIDHQKIQLNFSGAQHLKIDNSGNLVIQTLLGKIIEQKPFAYQIINGKQIEVRCQFKISGNTVLFDVGNYDESAILVIDPVLVFATYSGSVTDNFGMTATYGYDGTAYSAGTVFGNSYPTPDDLAFNVTSNFTLPTNPTYGITDVFVSKYSPDGSTMLWTTFLGGGNTDHGTETAHSLICDRQNNVYIYGATSSIDFPIVNGFQSSHGGGVANANFYFNGVFFTDQGTDIYVAKLSSNGHNLLGSTYMGGSENDGINTKVTSGIYDQVQAYDSLTSNYGDQFRGEIMLDSAGNCLVASCTRSTNFPILNAFQTFNAGMQDGVIFKLSSDLSSLQWSSYYGGTNNDACYSVKIDSSANILFAGGTCSTNLAGMSSGWQNSYNGGKTDGFIVKLNSSGSSILAGSYIGSIDYDQAFFVEIDRNDNVFLVGQSSGGNFPVNNSIFVNPGSSQFVIKLDPSLTTNLNSTVFGNGSPFINISPSAFLVDICGNLYISGWGANILQGNPMNGMPVSSNAFLSNPADGFDFYLLVIDKGFDGILYGSYLGGNQAHEHVDGGTSRFDKNGIVYQSVCGGCGGHSDFPTTQGAWSNTNLSTNCNNIVFKFDFQLIPNAEFSADQTLGCATFNVTLDNISSASDSYLWDFGNGDTTSLIFNPEISYSNPGIYDIFLYVTDSVCLLTDTAKITITVTDAIQLNTSDGIQLCNPTEVNFTANSNGTADYFIWSSSSGFSDTLNASISDSVLTITPMGSTMYYVMAGNPGCYEIDSVQVDFVSSSLILSGDNSLCLGETSSIIATSTNPTIAFNYNWGPDSLILSTSGSQVTVIPSVSQYLYLTANASNGCIIEDSILLSVGSIVPSSVVASASSYYVPQGSVVTLNGQPNGLSYFWSPPDLVTNPTMQSTSAKVDDETIFTLTVTDGICTKSDTVLVKAYSFICDQPFIFIPNAFSPNGDHENDILYVRGQMLQEMVFRVFDRWGELVFESTDRTIGWDGTFKGKALDPDVYDYYLKAVCIDGKDSIIKGNITLIK